LLKQASGHLQDNQLGLFGWGFAVCFKQAESLPIGFNA
jgi:hypothetical protein